MVRRTPDLSPTQPMTGPSSPETSHWRVKAKAMAP